MVNEDTIKIISSLAERFPHPDEFISLIESFNIPENEKGDSFGVVGVILFNHSKFKQALSVWERSLAYFIKNKDVSGESKCYTSLGIAYDSLGDYKKAIEFYEKSLKLAKEIGDVSGESKCYLNLGSAYQGLRDFSKAIEFHEKSLAIFKEIEDAVGESKCYGNLGNVYYSLGDFSKAIEFHKKSLAIDKQIGDVSGESDCYGNLGSAYYHLGAFSKAIEFYKKSLAIFKEIEDAVGKSKCYTNLGSAYYSLGDFKRAIEFYEKALAIKKEIGDLSGGSVCYTNLGNVYYSLGAFSKAIEFHEKALKIAKEIGDISGESVCYTNLGNVYQSLGAFSKAIEYHEKSLEIFKEIGDVSGESKCYLNLGSAYQGLRDSSKAIEYHEKSLEIFKEIADVVGESKCYSNLGSAYQGLGDFSKAIEYHEKSLKIAKEIGDILGLSMCYTNLGMLYEESGELSKSLNVLKKSIDIRESIKGEISLEELRMSFHAQAVSTYEVLSFVYLRQDEVAESINTLEWSKTRELADSLFYAEALKDNPKFREIIQEKSRLKNKVEVINKWKNAVSEAEKIAKDANINSIKTEIERTERKYATVSSTLHRLYDEVAGLRPKNFNIISNALDVLRKENGWVVLEYLLLPSKSELVVFVITEKGEINPVRCRYDDIKLDSSIEKYAEAVISSSKEKFREKAESELRELSAGIYTLLFPKDVEDALEGLKAKHLIIIPHKGLHLVPWEILFNGEDYLGLKYSISKNFSLDLTSIAMNKRLNVKNDGFAALLMGNPTLDLAGAETEVYKIENRLNSIGEAKTITLQRDKATKENFIDNIKNPLNIFHFSGHGQFQTPPGFSSLVFNNKNELTANELSGLSFNFKGSPIVSLSACESGITAPISGDELMGLIRGFIIAGASSIVSTSWRVYDNSACRLMVEFYENLINKNCVGLSLKKARETVFNDYNGEILHWGAYTLYGDPFRSIF